MTAVRYLSGDPGGYNKGIPQGEDAMGGDDASTYDVTVGVLVMWGG